MTNSVSLEYPVVVDGTTYSHLTLRRPKARDLLAADAVDGESRKTFAVYASLADVPLAVIMDLDVEDLGKLAEAAEAVMGKSPAAVTGEAQ